MQNYMFLFNGWWYVLILASIMILSGIIKKYYLFVPVFNFLIRKIKNKKLLVVLLSTLGGVLPVPGRVIISAGLLDTIASKDPKKRSKFGIVDYLATHHYYLWSPLEKTILIPMAVLKLSYLGVLGYTWPLLLISLIVLVVYILQLDSDDISLKTAEEITSEDDALESTEKKWFRFIDWKTILFVFVVIIIGNLVKQNSTDIKTYIETIAQGFSSGTFTFIWISIIAFFGSFIMGSSSKFAGITALLTNIFGLHYFTYFFAIEFAGYLLSPMHKCVAISMSYFKTPIRKYYFVILIWCILLIITGIITVLFNK